MSKVEGTTRQATRQAGEANSRDGDEAEEGHVPRSTMTAELDRRKQATESRVVQGRQVMLTTEVAMG